MSDPQVQDPVQDTATPPAQEPTLGMKLFPDAYKVEEPPKAEPEPAPAQEPPAVEPAPAPVPEPTPPAPPEPEILDLSAFQGKKVRVKVDGEEMEVPAESLVKNYQLESHLTRKGQRLGEKERALEELRRELLDKTQKDQDAIDTAVDEGQSPQEIRLLKQQLEESRKQLAQLNAVVAPIMFQQAVENVDQQIRSTLGFDDFKTYVPQIREFVKSKLEDPSVSVQEKQFYDTDKFWIAKYQELKLRELRQAAKTPPAPAPAPVAPAPRVTKIVPVEPAGGGAPTPQANANTSKLEAAFARARKSGSTEDWAAYYSLKQSAS